MAILDEEILVKDGKHDKDMRRIKGNIEFDNVCFNYPATNKKLIKTISLKIR